MPPAATPPRSFTPADEYAGFGLGPLPDGVDPADLYLDLVKRAVANVLYEDRPLWHLDDRKRLAPAGGFSLPLRWNGSDLPTEAHTMVGLRRLDSLRRCVETALAEGVPGDLVETGVFRGGAAIFLRAILKARGVTDRRVVACDTFVGREPVRLTLATRVGIQLVKWMAAVPSRRWRRRLFDRLQRQPPERRSFPAIEDPSDEIVDWAMFVLRHLDLVVRDGRDRTSLDAVRSHFARYGLLDDQVLFLKGFFADTLPAAPVDRVAVLRLDGDTYESTRDVLKLAYDKLSPGGFCVIDDYLTFPDCRRAVDEFRSRRGIGDEIVRIDDDAVYWRKAGAAGAVTDPARAAASV